MVRTAEKFGWTSVVCVAMSAGIARTIHGAATVSAVADPAPVEPGQTTIVTVRVSSDVAIYGYTLLMQLTAQEGAAGTVAFDADNSTFGNSDALIGEDLRHTAFSQIQLMDGDLLASTNTSDMSAVPPVAETGDVLLRAAVTTSEDASGTWEVSFSRPVSVLASGDLEAIETTWGTATVEVAPAASGAPCCCAFAAPLPLACLALGVILLCGRVKTRHR